MRGICPNPEKNMLMQVCFWLNSSDICVWFLLEDATWNFLLWVTFTGGFFETRETRKFIRICSQSLYVCKAAVTLTERFSTNSFAYFRLRNAAKIIRYNMISDLKLVDIPALVSIILNSLVVAELYRHSRFFSSQKWCRAGKPTIRSGKVFQTSKAKFISSEVRVTSSSSERNARVLTRAELWNLEKIAFARDSKLQLIHANKWQTIFSPRGCISVLNYQRNRVRKSSEKLPVFDGRRFDPTAPEDDDVAKIRTSWKVVKEGEDGGGGGHKVAGDGDDGGELVLGDHLRNFHEFVTERNEADRRGEPKDRNSQEILDIFRILLWYIIIKALLASK